MSDPTWITVSDEVRQARAEGRPVVALESTLIAHGLPFPTNIETALAAEIAVRDRGATPATIAVLDGRPTVGLTTKQLESLAQTSGVLKASRRELASAMVRQQTAATTVAATMFLAQQAGIAVFATGGLGGVHRGGPPFDISADLYEFTRTSVLVVCAGAKSILDLPQTLEVLEALGIPIWGYQTTDFPAFFTRTSGLTVPAVMSVHDAATMFRTHQLLHGGGAILAQPVAEAIALPSATVEQALSQAEQEAAAQRVTGAALTPFLLKRLAELTDRRTLVVNRSLIVANARLAADVAVQLCTGVV